MQKLTPEQRQGLWTEGQARRDQRMLKYAAASKAERQRMLDDDIRRMRAAAVAAGLLTVC